eukprot:g28283.t1
MEVALLIAGVSTGALVGAMSAFLMSTQRRSREKRPQRSAERLDAWQGHGDCFSSVGSVPMSGALVPYTEPPAKVRRGECDEVARERQHQEVLLLKQVTQRKMVRLGKGVYQKAGWGRGRRETVRCGGLLESG